MKNIKGMTLHDRSAQAATTMALFSNTGELSGLLSDTNPRANSVHHICAPLRTLMQNPTANSIASSWGWDTVITSRLRGGSKNQDDMIINAVCSESYANVVDDQRDPYLDLVQSVMFWFLEQDKLDACFRQLHTLRSITLSKYRAGELARWDQRLITELRIFRYWSHDVITTAISDVLSQDDIPSAAPWEWREPLYADAFFQWFSTNTQRVVSMLATAEHAVQYGTTRTLYEDR